MHIEIPPFGKTSPARPSRHLMNALNMNAFFFVKAMRFIQSLTLVALFVHTSVFAQNDVASALIAPANDLRNKILESYQISGNQFQIKNTTQTVRYQLTDKVTGNAGFDSFLVDSKVIYDQSPYFVIHTNDGETFSTNIHQDRVYEKCFISAGYYRDFSFRPFRFDGLIQAMGQTRYHFFSDRILKENRLSYNGNGFDDISGIYMEYPVAFASYQVYEGSRMLAVSKKQISSGAVVIERPNGSLLAFSFPGAPENGQVVFEVVDNTLYIRHYANIQEAITQSGTPGRNIVRWGRRIFGQTDFNTHKREVLHQIHQELNPYPSSAFLIEKVSDNQERYTQTVHQVEYMNLKGVYKFRTDGVPWGDAVTKHRTKYPAAKVTITPSDDRLIYMMHETNTPDAASALQDSQGYTLPVNLGIARSLGGGPIADWTGAFANTDPFCTEVHGRGWSRSEFPVNLKPCGTLSFRSLHVCHDWGAYQLAATGSVISQEPLSTSNLGVWCSIDLKPWTANCGDIRSFSSTVTQWAWGRQEPGHEEQFAHALEFYYASVGTRDKYLQEAYPVIKNFSHFQQYNRYTSSEEKIDIHQTFSSYPDTKQNRFLVDVGFEVKEHVTINGDERLVLFRARSNPAIYYNEIYHTLPDGSLNPEQIKVNPNLNIADNTKQTHILEGPTPAFVLADKRWTFAPATQFPNDASFRGVEANMFVRLFAKDITINGQTANDLPVALNVWKWKPEGIYYDGSGQPREHGHYIIYDMVLEHSDFSLEAGDKLRFSFMIMPYGGKISNDETDSAIETLENFTFPEVTHVAVGKHIKCDYQWVPAIQTTDGHSAEFSFTGGDQLMTVAAEGFPSYKIPDVYRINGESAEKINFSVNGYDGITTFIDRNGTVGFSFPVEMTPGEEATIRVVQDNQDGYGNIHFPGAGIATFWNFDKSLEGWKVSDDMSARVGHGTASLLITDDDAYIDSPDGLNIPATDYTFAVVGMQNNTSATTASLSWVTSAGGSLTDGKTIDVPIIGKDRRQRYYIIDLSEHTEWTDTIRQVRLRPAIDASGSIDIDFIKFTGNFNNVALSVPGVIQAEDFNVGGQGNAYYDTSPVNEGGHYRTDEGVDIQLIDDDSYLVGWIDSCEWLEYVFETSVPGIYQMDIHSRATDGEHMFHVAFDGEDLTGPIWPGASNTSFQEVVTSHEITLPEGLQMMRIFFDAAGQDLGVDKFTFDLLQECTPQSVIFDEMTDVPSDSPPIVLHANATSGLNPVFKVVDGPATIEGDTLWLTGFRGTITIKAYHPGNEEFCPASAVQSFNILHICTEQTLTYGSLPDHVAANDPPFYVSAEASSGLPVAVSIISGPATIDENNLVTLTNETGTIKFSAIQEGDIQWCAVQDSSLTLYVDSPQHLCSDSDGMVLFEKWTNIPGYRIEDIPLHTAPDHMSTRTSIEIPSNTGDHYGVRLSGYICAPYTADYVFFIASDDNGELWLSTDQSRENAALIAHVPEWTHEREWDRFPEQQSAPIPLTGGKQYYFEALMKEHTGGDNLAVKWQSVYGLDDIVGGDFLSMPCTWQTISFADECVPLSENTFKVEATATSGLPVNLEMISGNGELNGDTITLFGNRSTITLLASQEGNDLYCRAEDVTHQYVLSRTTGIRSSEDAHNIILYPNPASGIVTVHNNGLPVQKIMITDTEGRLLSLFDEPLTYKKTIDVHHLPGGIYLVHFIGSTYVVTKKMVIY